MHKHLSERPYNIGINDIICLTALFTDSSPFTYIQYVVYLCIVIDFYHKIVYTMADITFEFAFCNCFKK